MAHKVRKGMADRDAGYNLAGLVEMDESFFGPPGTTRGRGSEHKSTVLCAISLYRDRKGKEWPGFAHMAIVENASAKTIEPTHKLEKKAFSAKNFASYFKIVPREQGKVTYRHFW